MLKIKDNVNLKELEKFGFEKCEEERNYWKYVFLNKYGDELQYWVDFDTRIIEFASQDCKIYKVDATLYDLIKADLVEKVDD